MRRTPPPPAERRVTRAEGGQERGGQDLGLRKSAGRAAEFQFPGSWAFQHPDSQPRAALSSLLAALPFAVTSAASKNDGKLAIQCLPDNRELSACTETGRIRPELPETR